LKGLPVRAYLKQTVVPILLKSLTALVKERPSDPIEYMGVYFLSNKDVSN